MEQLYRELLTEALELFDGKHGLCDQVGTDEWAWKLQTLEVLAGSLYASGQGHGEQAGMRPTQKRRSER